MNSSERFRAIVARATEKAAYHTKMNRKNILIGTAAGQGKHVVSCLGQGRRWRCSTCGATAKTPRLKHHRLRKPKYRAKLKLHPLTSSRYRAAYGLDFVDLGQAQFGGAP